MASDGVTSEQLASLNGEAAESTATPGDIGVRTGAAVVAENHSPLPQESAPKEQPPPPPPPATSSVSAPSPSSGPHGSQPSPASVESRPPEEQQPAPPTLDMVVPVKAGADAKETPEVNDRAQRPKTPSGSPSAAPASPRPPSSNGNAPSPSVARPPTAVEDEDSSSDMGAEGSKFGAGKFRKASSADIQPLEEKTSVAKRSASSSGGFFSKNGRGSVSGMEASNGHREPVQSVAEEVEKSVTREKREPAPSSRPSSRQDISPPLGKVEESSARKKSPPLGPPSPIPTDSRSPTAARTSSKPSSPDLVPASSPSPKTKPMSPTEKLGRDVVKSKSQSPDHTDADGDTTIMSKGRISSPDIKKLDTVKEATIVSGEKKETKSPSPELLKTKSNGSLHASPEPGKHDRRLSEEPGGNEPLTMDSTGRKTPAMESIRSKSSLPPISKTPSPEPRKTNLAEATSLKSASPEVFKKASQEVRSPEPIKEKQSPQQSTASTPSPEPARTKSGSPEMIGISPISPKPLKTKPSSPDLKKNGLKADHVLNAVDVTPEIEDSNIGSSIKRTKSPSVEVDKPEPKLTQKSSSPELDITKASSPDLSKDKSRSPDSLRAQQKTPDSSLEKRHAEEVSPNKQNIEEKGKTKSPDLIPKTPSPDIPKSKPFSPEPLKSKPLTPEPPRSKPSTPEPSKLKTSHDGSDSDLRRSSSRLSNISDSDSKAPPSPVPQKTISASPKAGSPDIPISRKKSPELPTSESPSPEPDKSKLAALELQVKPKTPEPEKPINPVEHEATEDKTSGKPKQEVAESIKSISRSPEPAKIQQPHEPSKSMPCTPEPLKTKSPSQESIKPESLPPSSPKPESLPKALTKRSSSQKLISKSPSPEVGHRPSNPPSMPPSPEPIKTTKSPSPELSGVKSASPSQVLKDPLPPDSRRPCSVTPDVAAISPSASPDLKMQKKVGEETPAKELDGVEISSESITKPKVTPPAGKVSPIKLAEEVADRPLTPHQIKSPSPEPKKPPSPTSAKPPSPKDAKGETSEPKKAPSPTSPRLISSGATDSVLPETLEPTKSASPDSTKPISPVSQKSPSPPIPKSPSPITGKASPVQTPKSPSPAGGKPASLEVSKHLSPVAEKAPPVLTKSPSPVLKKSPSPEISDRKVFTQDRSLTPESEKTKTPSPAEPLKSSKAASPVTADKVKSPSPELDEQKDASSSPNERIKRPGSRQGISPEVVLSPSEDSGRTSASPDHFGRKSTTPPKSASPLPSSRSAVSPRAATPSSPEGAKEADVIGQQRTPDSAVTPADAKATAASSPTSEVGDEASTASRTGSASARPSSAEAATPEEEPKVEEEAPEGEGAPKAVEDGQKEESDKETKKTEAHGEPKKKKSEPAKPGTPSRTPRTPRSVAPSPRTPRRTTPRSRRKDGDHEKISGDSKGKSETKPSTNGEVVSPTKKSPTKIPAAKKSPATPTAATSSPARPPLKSPAKSKTPPAIAAAPTPESEKKKVPMNKVQVGTAASPNLKAVRSKIGSLDNASYKPGGGKVKIENRKLDFSKTAPKIAAKNDAYIPGGGDKKIQQVKLTWSAKPKVGSLDNATYRPGGGEKKIETVKLDFKEKAKPKVGSKDNIKHAPGGGTVKKTSSTKDDATSDIESQKLEFKDKAQSKVGSLDNVKHKPGGGERKIFDDKNYLKQVGGSSSKASSEGIASGAQLITGYNNVNTPAQITDTLMIAASKEEQILEHLVSPLPPMSPHLSENSVEES